MSIYISVKWIVDGRKFTQLDKFFSLIIDKGGEVRLIQINNEEEQDHITDLYGIKLPDSIDIQQVIAIPRHEIELFDWKTIDELTFSTGVEIEIGSNFYRNYFYRSSKVNKFQKEFDISIDELQLGDNINIICLRHGWTSIGDMLDLLERNEQGMIEVAGKKYFKRIIAALVEKGYLKHDEFD